MQKKTPSDIKKKTPLDVWTDILDVQVSPERLKQNLASYTEILDEIKKLRALDLTDVHPAIIFEPTAPYRNTEKS
jgi:putative NADH-flavin reductase